MRQTGTLPDALGDPLNPSSFTYIVCLVYSGFVKIMCMFESVLCPCVSSSVTRNASFIVVVRRIETYR